MFVVCWLVSHVVCGWFIDACRCVYVVWCVLFTVSCSSFVVCRLFVGGERCVLLIGWYALFAASAPSLLCGVWCVLVVVCCLLRIV